MIHITTTLERETKEGSKVTRLVAIVAAVRLVATVAAAVRET